MEVGNKLLGRPVAEYDKILLNCPVSKGQYSVNSCEHLLIHGILYITVSNSSSDQFRSR